jgi:hypothetical protein
MLKDKGKAVPLQAWSGPEGSRKLRFPDFITTAQDGGKVSLTHWPPLRLNEIQVRATSQSQMKGTEVARIVTALRDVEIPRQPIHWLWFVGMAIVFIAIGLLWSMWLRPIQICYQFMQKRVATRHQQPQLSDIQRLNSHGTELQVLNQGETTTEVARRPSPEKDPESPPTPTIFVRHGRVIGDQRKDRRHHSKLDEVVCITRWGSSGTHDSETL